MTEPAAIAVVVASLGRPDMVRRLLERLETQTLRPARVILSLSAETDAPSLDGLTIPVELVLGPRGSSVQRNRGLDLLPPTIDYVAFFDDDYVPSRQALAGIARAFEAFPEASGVGGQLLADGARNAGIEPELAIAMVEAEDARREIGPPRRFEGPFGVYGCNMVFRLAHVGSVRFDEAMPLYGWLEDTDFGARLPGPMVYTDAFFGVHCAVKHGREAKGRRLGYSQIANPIYLWRKGTLSSGRMVTLVFRPLIGNLRGILNPEPWIDRRGRLHGNLLAFAHLLRGSLRPDRIVQM